MKALREWMNEMTEIGVSDKEYADRMTMSGSKVETLEITGGEIENVVVGRILEIKHHEDSDHLFICTVDIGAGDPLIIVTGADNLTAGDVIPVALDGSTLPDGKKINSGTIRGVASQGMLCSLPELGLDRHDFPSVDEEGIFVLGEGFTIGDDIKNALGFGECVVEFEITSNRPDCLSIRGLARESAITFGTELNLAEPSVSADSQDDADVESIDKYLKLEVADPDLCPRYTARVVTGIKVEPSPLWMRKRLRACGIRPINNIVDITNYVMLEYGQPMHAFDLSCVRGGKIVVRRAVDGETLDTLDGIRRDLTPGMLLIADETGPIGIAGVMGGHNSEITEETKTIVFESACFDGTSVRRTSIALGMRTDASGRFEKGLDPMNTVPSVQRACELVELLGAGVVTKGLLDVFTAPTEPISVKLDAERINALLGTDINRGFMEGTLTKLGFELDGEYAVAPSWRSDIEGVADLAEEVARFYGYDIIEPAVIRGMQTQGGLSDKQIFEREVGSICRSLGFCEILTYSFTSAADWDRILLPQDSALRNAFLIQNPLGEDTGVMRTTTLPSMLGTLAFNLNRRNMETLFYEQAKIYLPVENERLADERVILTLGAYGGGIDFFDLKGRIETLLRKLSIKAEFKAVSDNPSYHPGRCAQVTSDGEVLGVFGQLHPRAADNFGMSGTEVFTTEIDMLKLMNALPPETGFVPLPRYPSMRRDVALICNTTLPAAEIERVIRESGGALLESAELFDIYSGGTIPEGKRSLAYTLTLRAPDKTLTDNDADTTVAAILLALKNELDITQR